MLASWLIVDRYHVGFPFSKCPICYFQRDIFVFQSKRLHIGVCSQYWVDAFSVFTGLTPLLVTGG